MSKHFGSSRAELLRFISTRRHWLLVGGSACALSLLFPCQSEADVLNHSAGVLEFEFPAMGSVLNVRYARPQNKAVLPIDVAGLKSLTMELVDKWNNVLSDYDPDSEASLAAKQADDGNWQQVSNDLAMVMNASDEWNHWSQGAFDVAIGAVTSLRRKRKLPQKEDWDAAQASSGWHLVEWQSDKSRFRTKRPGVRFDFGGIGKGFVADRIADLLNQKGIERFVINFAGNFRVGEPPYEREGWPVTIESLIEQDSNDRDQQDHTSALYRLRLARCAIATSGDRWQKFPDAKSRTRDEKSSHIIDPSTGLGIEIPQSVSVLTSRASDADAAATAACVQIRRHKREWLKTLANLPPGYCGVAQQIVASKLECEVFGEFDAQFGIPSN